MLAQLQKGITEADIDRSLAAVRQTPGLRAGYNFFLLPGMTWRDRLRTLRYVVTIPLRTRGRTRVFGLGWIRIEPATVICERALREGLIRPETALLPEADAALAGLFYRPSSLRWLERALLGAFRFQERGLKPWLQRRVRRGVARPAPPATPGATSNERRTGGDA